MMSKKMLNHWLLVIAAYCGLAATAKANCVGGKTLFRCVTSDEKVIELCDHKSRITYSYGGEIVVDAPRSNFTTTQFNGVGRYRYFSVDVTNSGSEYSIFFAADRITEAHEIEAGVTIEKAEENKSFNLCDESKEEAFWDIEDIDLAPTR